MPSTKVTVMRYNGETWELVGMKGFSAGPTTYVSLVISDGIPYVAYIDGATEFGAATVMKFNGESWESV